MEGSSGSVGFGNLVMVTVFSASSTASVSAGIWSGCLPSGCETSVVAALPLLFVCCLVDSTVKQEVAAQFFCLQNHCHFCRIPSSLTL